MTQAKLFVSMPLYAFVCLSSLHYDTVFFYIIHKCKLSFKPLPFTDGIPNTAAPKSLVKGVSDECFESVAF